MNSIQDVIERMKAKHPEIAKYSEMSKRDIAQMQVDNYNSSIGNKNEIDGYNCDVCHNKGYISMVRERKDLRGTEVFEEYLVPCKCDKIRKSIMRMKRSGLEKLFKKCRFDNYEALDRWQEGFKKKAMKFAKNPASVFFVGGQSGCGKTHLCTAISRELLLSGKELLYVLWQDESVKLKSVKNRDYDRYEKTISCLKAVDVLYIDDFLKVPIGEEVSRPTSADIALALEIINNRYNSQLITIVSSEWSMADIIDFDEALGGRLYELAEENVVNIKKEKSRNYRLRNIEEM